MLQGLMVSEHPERGTCQVVPPRLAAVHYPQHLLVIGAVVELCPTQLSTFVGNGLQPTAKVLHDNATQGEIRGISLYHKLPLGVWQRQYWS